MRTRTLALAAAVLVGAYINVQAAHAAYTRAGTDPILIGEIYANEWGGPFVVFTSAINSVCADSGRGMYLYNIEIATPNAQFRNNKMAMLLSAKMSGKRVKLDYYYNRLCADLDQPIGRALLGPP